MVGKNYSSTLSIPNLFDTITRICLFHCLCLPSHWNGPSLWSTRLAPNESFLWGSTPGLWLYLTSSSGRFGYFVGVDCSGIAGAVPGTWSVGRPAGCSSVWSLDTLEFATSEAPFRRCTLKSISKPTGLSSLCPPWLLSDFYAPDIYERLEEPYSRSRVYPKSTSF